MICISTVKGIRGYCSVCCWLPLARILLPGLRTVSPAGTPLISCCGIQLAQTSLCLALRPAGALPMHLHRALQAINGQKGAASAARPALLAPLMLLCRSEAVHGNQVC